MRRKGPRGPKFHLLCRIGPKKVLQTRRELASQLRASDGKKIDGRYFRELKGGVKACAGRVTGAEI